MRNCISSTKGWTCSSGRSLSWFSMYINSDINRYFFDSHEIQILGSLVVDIK
jgi:hypothetical protein